MRFRVPTLSRCIAGMIAMLFVAAISAVGQTQPPPTKASNTGTITGRVVNESGQALPNATVWAYPIGALAEEQMAITDHEGKFKLTGVQGSSYRISASMPAYTPSARSDNSQPANYKVGDSVTFTLIKGGVITGKVVTPEGEPVVAIGIRVEAIRDDKGRRLAPGSSVQEGATDDRGIYRVYGLPTATYIVMVGGFNDYSRTGINAFESNVPTYAPSSTREDAAEISLRGGEELTDVNITYRGEPGSAISGTVSGPAREEGSIAVILTSIGDAGAQRNDSMYHEPSIREFIFNGIADGDYYVTAQANTGKGEMAVSDSKLIKIRGADATGIELILQPLGTVNGRVVLEETKAPECTDKARPVFTETFVAAWHKEQEPARDRARFVWSFGSPIKADAQGNVVLRNLAAGEYRFVTQFSAKEWYLQSISFVTSGAKTPPARPVDAMKTWTRVKPGDRLSGLTVTLAQGAASLSGEIAVGEGESIPEKLVAYLVPAEREKADDVLRYYAAPVTEEGEVKLSNIAPGRYRMLVQPPIDGAESPLTKLRLPDATETRLRLRRAAEAEKEIELKPCQSVVDFRIKP